ncbi:septal ring lytic transglycosylase RlpA family protein [Rickettsia prowazekii]|uniref:septal ring lytic transglycosylase RlpA family protein n=1 Tax=Rickettsia prowazekii TaxID=782 RepID=UPI00059D84CE|nr:septal ring lytic transglycosylase RlpA family protein [Rickettsia prowazekii]
MIIMRNYKFKLEPLKQCQEAFKRYTVHSTALYIIALQANWSRRLIYKLSLYFCKIKNCYTTFKFEQSNRFIITKAERIIKIQHLIRFKDIVNNFISLINILLVLIFCINLSGCNASKKLSYSNKYSYKELSKDDPHNLTYIGHYKVGKNYKIKGKIYKPHTPKYFTETGYASWYGGRKDGFHGKTTANGDRFNRNLLTAAHKTLPLPCLVKVTNKVNNKSVILMVNDRGPFKKNRIIDVSQKAAEILAFKNQGVTKVRIEYLPNETEKFFKKINLKKPENKTFAKNHKKSLFTQITKNNQCSINCHIKLVNLKYKLAVNP